MLVYSICQVMSWAACTGDEQEILGNQDFILSEIETLWRVSRGVI